ncbi:helix-turn-helix domain-containing protein [Streptomyces hygroscopicus]|uniref:helix-turn-helix domain-containing protein n=1 Tax=Streptomyces hygroscopicus TaxID=1912 RepID=UPI0004C49AAF
MHGEGANDDLDAVLAAVGPRLRALRRRRGATLTAVSETTGIPISILSRLEFGRRRPGLELLLPLARALNPPPARCAARPGETADHRLLAVPTGDTHRADNTAPAPAMNPPRNAVRRTAR